MKRRHTLSHLAAAAAVVALALPLAARAADEIRIAHVHSLTGPLEAYGKQTRTGFMMGLEFATGGTMTVAGKKLVVIEKDDQGKPDLGKSLLAAAYADDKADIAVGPTSSGVALAMLPVAEEYKKILLVEPAVADSITGEKWNKYIFRTGRNSSQDAISNAVALDKPGVTIATLAQDYAFGRDGVKAFKEAVKKAKIVHEEYLPTTTTDFTAGAQRIIDKLKDQPGRKIIWIIWAGGGGNPFKIADLDLKRYGIEIATGGNILPAMAAYKQFPGMEGATYYYFGIPKNPVNEWLVANHYTKHKAPPDGKYDTTALSYVEDVSQDPLANYYVGWAQRHGISQAAFDELAAEVNKMATEGGAAPVDIAAEKKALGPNADATINGMVNWARGLVNKGVWGAEDFEEFKVMGGTARGMKALMKIREAYEGRIPVESTPMEGAMSDAELQSMVGNVNDPNNPYVKDPAYRQKVERLFSQRYSQ